MVKKNAKKSSSDTKRAAAPPGAPAVAAEPPAPPANGRPFSPDELMERGKAMRLGVPRSAHAAWRKPANRFDPIALLQKADAERLPELVPVRYWRMLVSPFTFYRGSAAVMAGDLAGTPATGLQVQACGDAHLANFGGFATPERNIIFDVNDFDETLPAPWEWDVKRLAASIVLAARDNGLGDADGKDAAIAAARSYREHLSGFARMSPLDVWYARVSAEDVIGLVNDPAQRKLIRKRIDKAQDLPGSEMDYPRLAGMTGGQIHIRDTPPLIFHPEMTRAPDFDEALQRVLAAYRETLPAERRALLDHYRLVDAAIKVVGIGSVGRSCWIALFMSAANDPLFLQFKEARASVLEPFAGASAYPHHGQRVVMGQRLMQPASDVFLGWVTGPGGRQFYVRQLRDAKIKPLVETFDAETLAFYSEACGWALARGHAKAGDAWTISGYLGSGNAFDDAMGDFALAYADQAEADHAALKRAVRAGKVTVMEG